MPPTWPPVSPEWTRGGSMTRRRLWTRLHPRADCAIWLLIGVNHGAIAVDGAAINAGSAIFAACLEATSEPGVVCMSKAVHEPLEQHLAVGSSTAMRPPISSSLAGPTPPSSRC